MSNKVHSAQIYQRREIKFYYEQREKVMYFPRLDLLLSRCSNITFELTFDMA